MSESFRWPAYPRNEVEFDELMRAIDTALTTRGLKPAQRPLNVPMLFGQAFGWSGNILPPEELAQRPGYTGDTLMAKAHRWYDQHYGEKLKVDFAVGSVPYKLANAIWRVRLGVIYGSVMIFADRNLSNAGTQGFTRGQARSNALCAIEDLPQALAHKLGDEDLERFLQFYVSSHATLKWHSDLQGSELFRVARDDYATSTSDLLSGRFGQARWAAQQAVEKTIKGFLAIRGIAFPTSGHRGQPLRLARRKHGLQSGDRGDADARARRRRA